MLNKFILIVSAVGFSVLSADASLPIENKKDESVRILKFKMKSLSRRKRFLEEKAERVQFEKGTVQEARDLFSEIDHIQLQLNELSLKIDRLENSTD